MSDVKPYEGGCLCGAVRYRATSAPMRGVICHCSMCRRHSGAPVLAFAHFVATDFTWTRGQPTRFRSSKFAERGFCSTCGSTVSMHESVLADRVQIAVGSLDEPSRVRIDDHVWTGQAIDWLHIVDQLPRFARSSTAVPTEAPGGRDQR